MKFKYLILVLIIPFIIGIVSCSTNKNAIELMGAGDRIHDTYTFANVGLSMYHQEDNRYIISGSVEKLENESVKNEFDIDNEVTHVVAIKLSAVEDDVEPNDVQINVNGVRNYDAEHLNGSSYTFIILECVPNSDVNITVKWNNNAEEKNYIIHFDEDLLLK